LPRSGSASPVYPARRESLGVKPDFGGAELLPPAAGLTDGVVSLRPFEEGDLPAFERALADRLLRRWWFSDPGVKPGDVLTSNLGAWAQGVGSLAVCDLCDACLGGVRLTVGGSERVDIGYWLLPQARGRGFATRALKLVAAWSFTTLAIERLQLWTDPENVKSQRVAERAGFSKEGVLRLHSPTAAGDRCDAVLYSLPAHNSPPARCRTSRKSRRLGSAQAQVALTVRWSRRCQPRCPVNRARRTLP
jgi:RimJ/RimL family protein N-acetyltransferase